MPVWSASSTRRTEKSGQDSGHRMSLCSNTSHSLSVLTSSACTPSLALLSPHGGLLLVLETHLTQHCCGASELPVCSAWEVLPLTSPRPSPSPSPGFHTNVPSSAPHLKVRIFPKITLHCFSVPLTPITV